MSLIALTEHLRSGRSMARTLMLLIALTGAVIVGLLAMHSLNSHTPVAENDHHASVVAVASGASAGDSHAAAAEEPCADCGTGHSDMITMACVLALLATVLLLARPHRVHQWLSVLVRPGPPAIGPPRTSGLRPPSLTVLCISRT